jgi:hypothetical protein
MDIAVKFHCCNFSVTRSDCVDESILTAFAYSKTDLKLAMVSFANKVK